MDESRENAARVSFVWQYQTATSGNWYDCFDDVNGEPFEEWSWLDAKRAKPQPMRHLLAGEDAPLRLVRRTVRDEVVQ